jgi:hypothetical protein
MAWFDDLIGAGINIAGVEQLRSDLNTSGNEAMSNAQQVGATANQQSQFRPFTVTSQLGNVQATPEGGFNTNLSNQQQGISNQFQNLTQQGVGQFGQNNQLNPQFAGNMFGGAQNFANQSQQQDPRLQNQITSLFDQFQQRAGGVDRAQREQDIFGQLRALQQPEEERQRLSLEERLFAQGRGGVRTSQFGGTPEQLAMAQAQGESQNQAALMALQQSGVEDQQNFQQMLAAGQSGAQGLNQQQGLQMGNANLANQAFNLGQAGNMFGGQLQSQELQNLLGLQQGGFAGQNQLLNQLQPAVNLSNIAGVGQRQGAGFEANANMAGNEAQMNAQLQRAGLTQDYFKTLAQLAGGQGQAQTGLLSSLLNSRAGTSGSGGGQGGTFFNDTIRNAASGLFS